MKKRLISLFLMLMLVCAPAYALDKAAATPDWDALERYASFSEDGTVWSVRSNQTEAALRRMSSETAPYNGYACFGMELTGDRETGIVVPALVFYYAGSIELKGEVASIAVGGKRYDLALCGESVQLGKNKAEKLSAPLDADGIQMIREMLNAEEISILITGDTAFEIEPEEKDAYNNAREELAARSMDGLSDMLREFEAIEPYELWDLNEDWWTLTRGVEPGMQAVALPADEATVEDLPVELEEPMYLLRRGNQGEDVRDLQKLLIENGYIQGKADGAYGEGTVRAVRAAQRWMGLMETGMADETFLRMLTGSAVISDEVVSATAVELHSVEGLCELTIERCWTADAVASKGGDRRTVADKDDTMMIYEGTVKNLSCEDLDFYWQMAATLKYGEYEYPCVLVCERNEGATLATALPPLGEARLLIYAEIPETIADVSGWMLEIEAGDTVLTIE